MNDRHIHMHKYKQQKSEVYILYGQNVELKQALLVLPFVINTSKRFAHNFIFLLSAFKIYSKKNYWLLTPKYNEGNKMKIKLQ